MGRGFLYIHRLLCFGLYMPRSSIRHLLEGSVLPLNEDSPYLSYYVTYVNYCVVYKNKEKTTLNVFFPK